MPNSSAARAWTFELLKVCRGKLGTDADEELAAMQKTCASIMGFVHNHPEQLNRVRRFREYYLPTTRKLLDTAQGLGDTDSANAAEIRRDITGILHMRTKRMKAVRHPSAGRQHGRFH